MNRPTKAIISIPNLKNNLEVVRRLIGPTNGAEAPPGTIRGDFSVDIRKNIVHASDSIESAEKEIKIHFTEDEILHYKRPDEDWL